jgi:hypothetical protein
VIRLQRCDSRAVPQNESLGVAAGLADEGHIPARLAITRWMLATGGALHADVPPRSRAQRGLVPIWAYKQTTVSCVAVTEPISRRAAR